MAQILALEWDTHEIRMLSANLRGTDVTVEKGSQLSTGETRMGILLLVRTMIPKQVTPTPCP